MSNLILGLLIGFLFGIFVMFSMMIAVIKMWIAKGKITWNE